MWPKVCAFLAGSCLVLCLPRLPSWPAAAACAALVAGVAVWPRARWLIALVLGSLYCLWQADARLADRLDPALEGKPLTFDATVVSVPQGTPDALRFRVAPSAEAHLPDLVDLTWYDAPWRPQAAERLRIEAKLRRPRGFANPGGTDNDARMLRERVGASGYVRFATPAGEPSREAWAHPVLAARAAVADAIREALGARASAGIVAGLSVGLQDALSRQQWVELSRSGTSHLMAISGLHIAMVAAVAGWLGGRIQRWRQSRGATGARRDVEVVCAGLAAVGYSALAGMSVPTQRTLVMIALGAAALLARRRIGLADGLAACAGAVVLLDPLAPLAPGFWLSFGAVAAILFATSGYLRGSGTWRAYLQVQGAVTLGLTPVLAASFGNVSLVSVVVNLFAIPLYTLCIVPAVLVSSAVAVASQDVGAPLLRGTGWLVEATWPLIAMPASWPLATVAIAQPGPLGWTVLCAGTVAALAPLPLHGRVAGVAMMLAACAWRPAAPAQGEVRCDVLDVGQGLATFLQTRSHALVYDAGPSFRSGTDAGQLVVLPFLRARGIRVLDRLVLSHDDDDHKGGASTIVAGLPVTELVAGPSLRDVHAPMAATAPRVTGCARGERWSWDGVEFEWLHPVARLHERDNDRSCVLLVTAGEHSILLTGDIEAEAERELLEAAVLRPVEILVAPHHGSRSSSTSGFAAATSPSWVVFTAGHRNRWGFPAPRVVARWQGEGARTLETSATGAIEFEARPGRALAPPGRWRIDHHRFWQDP
jgi:competence protein ComEC